MLLIKIHDGIQGSDSHTSHYAILCAVEAFHLVINVRDKVVVKIGGVNMIHGAHNAKFSISVADLIDQQQKPFLALEGNLVSNQFVLPRPSQELFLEFDKESSEGNGGEACFVGHHPGLYCGGLKVIEYFAYSLVLRDVLHGKIALTSVLELMEDLDGQKAW